MIETGPRKPGTHPLLPWGRDSYSPGPAPLWLAGPFLSPSLWESCCWLRTPAWAEGGKLVLQVIRLEGGRFAPSLCSRLMMAPCHRGRLKPMWFLALCACLEPSRSPLTAGILPVRQAAEGPPRRGGLGCRARDGPSQRELLLPPAAASGGAQQRSTQLACPPQGTVWSSQAAAAPSSFLVQLQWPRAQTLWPVFLAACWVAWGEEGADPPSPVWVCSSSVSV